LVRSWPKRFFVFCRSQMLRVVLWAFTIANFWQIFFAVKYCSDLFGRNQILNSYAIASLRIIFGLTLAWIIYACHSGRGGVVNRFLSSKYWMPLSRLSFCLYLASTVIQYNLIASTPYQLNLETSHMVREVLEVTSSNSLERFRNIFHFNHKLLNILTISRRSTTI
jgi:hypothetical protein